MLAVGGEGADTRPAVLVMGAVDARQIVASELAVGMAREIVARRNSSGDDQPDDRLTYYVIPRPSPDATERLFASPVQPTSGNARSTDDDRDGAVDEDPPEDLNGDGFLTTMRVADATGKWMEHPDEPRILIEADASRGELGKYRLLSEGIDNDGDQQWNEDGPGGVDFNKNFTFEYPYFAAGAGPHQMSEPETRAVADFCFDRTNIFMVFAVAPQHNLVKPWTPAANETGRIKNRVLKADAAFYKSFADTFAKHVKNTNAAEPAAAAGSFVHWAYFHYGRWSVASPGWSLPEVKPPSDDSTEKADGEPATEGEGDSSQPADKSDEQQPEPKSPAKKPDSRAARERNALAWLASIERDGFVDWQPVEHPDFAGQKVEVGGFVPLAREVPPRADLDELATKHTDFLVDLVAMRPQVEIINTKLERLSPRIVRVEATAINRGSLPTKSAMGALTRKLNRLELAIELPEGARLLSGTRRYAVPVLAAHGGNESRNWLIEFDSDTLPSHLTITLAATGVGEVTTRVEIDEQN
jgi:hypothetical protein